jgi:uncharacterized membrane protein YkgB
MEALDDPAVPAVAAPVAATPVMAPYSFCRLRVSIGVVFLWFGVLKYFPNLSPAEMLATSTLEALTFGAIGPRLAMMLLATFESAIGIILVTGWRIRAGLAMLLMHLVGTGLPLILFPRLAFAHAPYAPTLEGQYILKNVVFFCAALALIEHERCRRVPTAT